MLVGTRIELIIGVIIHHFWGKTFPWSVCTAPRILRLSSLTGENRSCLGPCAKKKDTVRSYSLRRLFFSVSNSCLIHMYWFTPSRTLEGANLNIPAGLLCRHLLFSALSLLSLDFELNLSNSVVSLNSVWVSPSQLWLVNSLKRTWTNVRPVLFAFCL